MRTLHIAAVGVAASLGIAAPATAGPTYYFECVGQTPIQNRENETRWSQARPTASLRDGAGCGQADPGVRSGSGYDGRFGGPARHGETLHALNFELHSAVLPPVRTKPLPLRVSLTVDGEYYGPLSTFRVVPVRSPHGLSETIRFSIVGLNVENDLGVGHIIRFSVESPFVDYTHAWLYGAAEVPAHVEINPEVPTEPRIAAAPPPVY